MITNSSNGITKAVILVFRYLIVLVGLNLAATFAAGLFALGVVDFGLTATAMTWFGVAILCVDLLLVLYLLFSHLTKWSSRSSVWLYGASLGLFVSSLVFFWFSKWIDNCATSEAFVICAASGTAWQIFGFALGGAIVIRLREKERQRGQV
jgi:hypothetical protein